MTGKLATLISLAVIPLLTGCMSHDDHLVRTEGVTKRAGDAIARNSVLQMVDPWPEGVEDTNLKVPADRGDEGESDVLPGGGAEAASTKTN